MWWAPLIALGASLIGKAIDAGTSDSPGPPPPPPKPKPKFQPLQRAPAPMSQPMNFDPGPTGSQTQDPQMEALSRFRARLNL